MRGETVIKGKGGSYIGGVWWGMGGEKGERKEKSKQKEEPEVVVFIPHTPEGILKRRLQERDQKMVDAMGMRKVKFVERGGQSLQGILSRSNPWREKDCGGKDCLVCQTEPKGKCRTESVVYEVKCGRCEGEGEGVCMWGRVGGVRGREGEIT